MNEARIMRGVIGTLVICIVAAANSACSSTGYGCGPLCSFGGGGGGGGNSTPPPIFSTTTIAANDTEPVNAGGTQWDITQVKTAREGFVPGGPYTQITVFVTFAQATAFSALPAPGAIPTSGSALGILVYFDTDLNPATGVTSPFCGGAYQGMEYVVSDGAVSGRLLNGNYDIINLSTLTKSGEATVNGGSVQVNFVVPLSAIPGVTSGLMGVAASNFMNGSENVVDCAPDGTTVST